MKDQIPWKLLGKYFSEESSDEESKKLMAWVNHDKLHRHIFDELRQVWNETERSERNWDVDAAWDKVNHVVEKRSVGSNSKVSTHHYKVLSGSSHTLRKYLLSAAAVFLLAALVGWYYYANQPQAKAKYEKYVTQQGEQTRIELADGSAVTMNEETTLRIPRSFSQSNRNVYIDGEAFFDIHHDTRYPFKVHTGGGVAQVLGTRFNVKSRRRSDHVQVAVIEGMVALYSRNKKQESGDIITFNHIGSLNKITGRVSTKQVDVRNYISWLTKRLYFENTTLLKISRQLEELYNVHITFGSNSLKKERVTANFKKTSLKDALDIILGSMDITYRKEGSTVTWLK